MPPQTAASAWSATRTTLLAGCWAVRVEPAVWVWKRSQSERGSSGAKRSATSSAQSRRAARNFATSSRKLLWALKKKERRGAKSSIASPRESAAST